MAFQRRSGENDQLFGSVTSSDIAEALERKSFHIDRRKIQLHEPLKSLGEFDVPVKLHRGREVTGFRQDDTGVDVEVSDGRSLRAQYLVGCDGGRSLIRKKAGIDFPGWEPSVSYLIAEGEMTGEQEWGIRPGNKGINGIGKLEDGKRARVVLCEQHVRQGD